jgi:hypothetical protein
MRFLVRSTDSLPALGQPEKRMSGTRISQAAKAAIFGDLEEIL